MAILRTSVTGAKLPNTHKASLANRLIEEFAAVKVRHFLGGKRRISGIASAVSCMQSRF
ncbi:hypothetical protein Dalk_1297 [Desulfatibacillum aliphaticivorans]|uniref:Uncharacterized protein n=1 Tax=Desulfatibacillum aliphaticivorans TaxID=218208 RepID=B8F9Q4_DESAL|nr:hypothetical protein Dalk_1297 [Desulfatibacillum aliphaticivorans]